MKDRETMKPGEVQVSFHRPAAKASMGSEGTGHEAVTTYPLPPDPGGQVMQRVIVPIYADDDKKTKGDTDRGAGYLKHRHDGGNIEKKEIKNVPPGESIYFVGHGTTGRIGNFNGPELYNEYLSNLDPNYDGRIQLISCESGDSSIFTTSLAKTLQNTLVANGKNAVVWGADRNVRTARTGTNVIEKSSTLGFGGFSERRYREWEDTLSKTQATIMSIVLEGTTKQGPDRMINPGLSHEESVLHRMVTAFKAEAHRRLPMVEDFLGQMEVQDEKSPVQAVDREVLAAKLAAFLTRKYNELKEVIHDFLKQSGTRLFGDPKSSNIRKGPKPAKQDLIAAEARSIILHSLHHFYLNDAELIQDVEGRLNMN